MTKLTTKQKKASPTTTVSACPFCHKEKGNEQCAMCGDLPTTPHTETTISLCESCYCMTKTIEGKCGKCKADKPTVEKWEEELNNTYPFSELYPDRRRRAFSIRLKAAKKFIRTLLTHSLQEAKAERDEQIVENTTPRGFLRCTWCKQEPGYCECKRNMKDLLASLKQEEEKV